MENKLLYQQNKNLFNRKRTYFVVLLTSLLLGCASPVYLGSYGNDLTYSVENYPDEINYLQNLIDNNPKDIEAKIELTKYIQRAVEYYLKEADLAVSEGNFNRAISFYDKAILIESDNDSLRQRKQLVMSQLEIAEKVNAARSALNGEEHEMALSIAEHILLLSPNNQEALAIKEQIELNIIANHEEPLLLIDVAFNQIDLPSALQFLADTYGFNLVLDQSVKDTAISLNLNQIPLESALDLLLSITRNSYSVIRYDTLLVYADSRDNRNKYETTRIHTFRLNSVPAKDMLALIKNTIEVTSIIANEQNNSLIVVDTESVISRVGKLITDNDYQKGEVIFDVEIMEVNLTSSLLSGIDYGAYQIGSSTDPIPLTGSIRDSIKESTNLVIPGISLNAFKQDVDARILANPKIRVMDGENAKIHIGERVPLRSSDILDATGQTRTTFEYQDVGIRLTVEPTVHLNAEVTIKVALEVSSLGENIGTVEQQAFKIGTRNIETVMLVKDGETAILGGLIRDERRSSLTGLPITEKDSWYRRIFGNEDISDSRSDVLLTIRPRIVRSSNVVNNEGIAEPYHQAIGNGLSGLIFKPVSVKADIENYENSRFEVIIEEPDESSVSEDSSIHEGAVIFENNEIDVIEKQPLQAIEEHISNAELSFSETDYYTEQGAVYEVTIHGALPTEAKEIHFEVAYNPTIIEFTDASTHRDIDDLNTTSAQGSVTFSAQLEQNRSNQQIVKIRFEGKREGVSHLIIRDAKYFTSEGEGGVVEINNSRIKVR